MPRGGMPALVLGDAGLVVRLRQLVPQETARANRDHAPLGELQSPSGLGRAFQSGPLANRVVDRRMQHDHRGELAVRLMRHHQVGLGLDVALGLVANAAANDAFDLVRFANLENGRTARIGVFDRADHLTPLGAQIALMLFPMLESANRVFAGVDQQRQQGRTARRNASRAALDFGEPGNFSRSGQAWA